MKFKNFKIRGDTVVRAKWTNYGSMTQTIIRLRTRRFGASKLMPLRFERIKMPIGIRVEAIANPKTGIVRVYYNKHKK